MNWEKIGFEEIVWFQEGPGVRNTQFRDSGVKLLNVGNINNNNVTLSSTRIYISEQEAFGKYKHFLVDEGDLIIASSGVTLDTFHKKIAWVNKEHLPLCMNTSTIRFKPKDKSKLSIKYFSYFLRTPLFNTQLRKLITGSAQLNFGPSHLKQMWIPLPPLPIQQQIADTLDKADALRRKDQELLDKYDELAQAVFYEMFGDPVKNEKNWKKSELGKIVKRIVVGHVGPTSDGYSTTGIPFLRTQNVRNGYINFSNLNYITHEFHRKLRKSILSEGDVLVSRVGVNRGMAAYVPKELDGANCANVVIIGKTSALNPCYLSFYLNATYGVSSDFGYSVGSAQGVVNTTMVKKWLTLVPPIQLQNEFEFRFNHILNQKKLTQKICNRSEDLHNLLTNTLFS